MKLDKERLLERVKAIELLENIINNCDIDKLAFITPLTDKQKKFLKLLKSGKTSIAELTKAMPCSRPMVYKHYEIFFRKKVMEIK